MTARAPVLTIAVSTLGDRVRALRHWHFDPRVRYLVLWQLPGEPVGGWPDNVEVMALAGTGVARSRNAAIERCSTPWLWFMDDDVEFPPGSIDALLARLPHCADHELLVATVRLPDGRALKRRADGHRYSRRDIMAVGTIQIVAQADWLRRHGVRFPSLLGAGATYPVCDEPVFLARALDAGARVLHADTVSIVHGEHSSGGDLTSPQAVRARAIAFYEIFGVPGCLAASAYFWLRHARAIGSRWPSLFHYGAAD